VTYGIITRHGGRIEVESAEGEGATFNIRLPVSSGAEVKKQPERKAVAVESARILLVDDDLEVGEVLELMLKQLGHRVTAVNTGEAAVNTFEIGEFDMVITDLGMPDMPGSDVARAVKDIRPGTPVLLITGWGVQLDREELPEVDGVVAKPFSKDTLSQQLSGLLAPKKSRKKKKK
jgi:CheY-like chemotaxis protein